MAPDWHSYIEWDEFEASTEGVLRSDVKELGQNTTVAGGIIGVLILLFAFGRDMMLGIYALGSIIVITYASQYLFSVYLRTLLGRKALLDGKMLEETVRGTSGMRRGRRPLQIMRRTRARPLSGGGEMVLIQRRLVCFARVVFKRVILPLRSALLASHT